MGILALYVLTIWVMILIYHGEKMKHRRNRKFANAMNFKDSRGFLKIFKGYDEVCKRDKISHKYK